MANFKRFGSWAAFLFYVVIALEVIIMITPFTVYFYSIYAPILNFLYRHEATAWLTGFFFPHLAVADNSFLIFLSALGPLLFISGLFLFLICALQVYGAKLFRRGVVTGGLYSFIRHPQYLSLGISGLGLLLFWPRFIILILFISMLFVYYFLARDEERRMKEAYPKSYEKYIQSVPSMFIPGNIGGKIFAIFPFNKSRRGFSFILLYIFSLAIGIGVAIGLREFSKSQIATLKRKDILVISLAPQSKETMSKLLDISLKDTQVRGQLKNKAEKDTIVAYLLPSDYMMQGLIASSAMEHEEHHGKISRKGIGFMVRHIWDMLTLRPMRQLNNLKQDTTWRLIFSRAVGPNGKRVDINEAMSLNVRRKPIFFVDIGPVSEKVTFLMETKPEHLWGNIPMPIF